MLPVPDDKSFVTFVNDLSHSGASAQTIACALNQSVWADTHGRQWHWRQVAAMVGVSNTTPGAGRADTATSTKERMSQRRLAVLRAIRDWRPFDEADLQTVWVRHKAGESLDAIAADLNSAGSPAPNGRRWTRFWVNVLLHVCAAGASVPADLDAWVALNA